VTSAIPPGTWITARNPRRRQADRAPAHPTMGAGASRRHTEVDRTAAPPRNTPATGSFKRSGERQQTARSTVHERSGRPQRCRPGGPRTRDPPTRLDVVALAGALNRQAATTEGPEKEQQPNAKCRGARCPFRVRFLFFGMWSLCCAKTARRGWACRGARHNAAGRPCRRWRVHLVPDHVASNAPECTGRVELRAPSGRLLAGLQHLLGKQLGAPHPESGARRT